MTVRDAIEAQRMKEMEPLLPWCTAEPCITLPLTAVLVSADRGEAYITLADLVKAFAGNDH